MAHVELSISEGFLPPAGPHPPGGRLPTADPRSLERWAATVAGAVEPSLVIDAQARILASSAPLCTLLGLGDPYSIVGRYLLDGVLRLVDFTAARVDLTEAEIDKIPPLLALSSGRLARGLMRVHGGGAGAIDATVDAIATPLWEGTTVAGSLTFFSEI